MDLIDALSTARRAFLDALGAVPPERWAAPSRWPGRTVRDVADHVLDLTVRLTLLRGGADPGEAERWRGADHLGSDPHTRAGIATWELLNELAGPGQLDGTVALPGGDRPARQVAERAVLELWVHAWDLSAPGDEHGASPTGDRPGTAQAAGPDAADGPDDRRELAAFLLPLVDPLVATPDPLAPADAEWGPPLPAEPEADPAARLLARVGRRP